MRAVFRTLIIGLGLLAVSCAHEHDEADGGHVHGGEAAETENWAVTAWGEHFEIFAEAEPLVVGAVSRSHTHVTILDGFQPLVEGRVTAILRSAGGTEEVFVREEALRAGIFSIDIAPSAAGEFDLFFRVQTAARDELIPSGRVSVGSAESPGGLVEPPPGPSSDGAGCSAPVGFLKEQQWKTSFATAWTERGAIRRTVMGAGRLRAAAGGDVVVSSPVNGVVDSDWRGYPGLRVRAGEPLLHLRPRASAEQSISELRSELALARLQLERAEKLRATGAVSEADVEPLRARVAALEPLVESSATAEEILVASPLSGAVAEVWVTAGAAVEAGDSLLRVVKTAPVWLEAALPPAAAAAVSAGVTGLHLRLPGEAEPLSFVGDALRLVALSPSVDPATGTVTALLEIVPVDERLRLGAAVEAAIAVAERDSGVVIPAAALVDDGGTTVVYCQIEGEAFTRHEVHVRGREGTWALVEGIAPGMRLVTRGGAMIRRASLLSSGGIEGHVH